uniref:vacuolar protein sorting-associated protein 32 homolog 2-like n=1 Tax=Fragaria vesca subsp. vesca TaxID=101020 RepID=UPI0005C9DA38|nr:PREDICTED: vacuolar protein sorting-associated protein 32 homolog 2-like [Fragaria vesca subsp. vesca]
MLDKLHEKLGILEKNESEIQKKAAVEFGRAKEFARAKNRKDALQCLKRKKVLEKQIEEVGSFRVRIRNQMMILQGANADESNAMQKANSIADKTVFEINEQRIQEALSSIGSSAANFDDHESVTELEELERDKLEEQATSSGNYNHSSSSRNRKQPTSPNPHKRREGKQAAHA